MKQGATLKKYITGYLSNYGKSFSKNDEGADIYYPWLYPGEAFLLNAKTKKQITAGGLALFFSLLFSMASILVMEHYAIISLATGDALSSIMLGVHSLVYVSFVSFFSRRVELYSVKKDQRPIKISIFTWIWVYWQISLGYDYFEDADLADPVALLLLLMIGGGVVFNIFLLLRVIKTRGYLFERKASPLS